MEGRRCLAQITSNGFMKWSAWDVGINIMLMEAMSGKGNARNVKVVDHNIIGREAEYVRYSRGRE